LGEPERIVVDSKCFSEYAHLQGEFKIPARGLTELDRLSAVVSCIDCQCSIVPQGAYKKNTLGEVKRNEAFNGLNLAKNFDLSNYSRLRVLQNEDKIAQKNRKADVFVHDFLDPVTDKCNEWCVKRDTSQTVAIMRSLRFPGFLAFARANSGVHGSVYIGNGM